MRSSWVLPAPLLGRVLARMIEMEEESGPFASYFGNVAGRDSASQCVVHCRV